ncbi:MAG: RNA 2',3'-cyclic phosphodiesterase [Betaproteobacteria bacterium]
MRCFVALWPDPAARARLAALTAEQQARFPQARPMRTENLHLTLAFIGELDEPQARAVAQAVAGIDSLPFDWTLDRIGAFARAQVLWAGGPRSEALEALAARARATLDALAIHFDRKPFVAHVTLLRDLPRAQANKAVQPIAPPLLWHAARPVLLRSATEAGRLRYVEVAPPSG